jgi:hypothetical protein
MTVRAMLDGHPFDLRTLAGLFPNGDPSITQDPNDDGRYFLNTSALDALFAEPGAMHAAACALLVRLVGAARLEDDSFRSVQLVGRYDRPRPGGVDTKIYVHDTAVVRDRVTVVAVESIESHARVGTPTISIDGQSFEPAPPRGPRYLTFAHDHPDVAELLTLIGNADRLGWVELYKAYEIIRDAVSGGRNGIPTLAGRLDIPESEIKRFTGSANRPDVSGPDARHARQSGPPPKQSMTLPDGRHFIRDLARRWLETL